ncbi:MAG: LbtU family siderophore porin [Gammaproteobacteria bacterium]|nr:LbtU family siderophore porin [Gammaproteobacteria bacterium]
MKKLPLAFAVSSALILSTQTHAEEVISVMDAVEIGGLIEVEAQNVSPDGAASSSDIYVATAELGIGAKINKNVTADMVLLYEGPDATLELDAATITITPDSMPLSFTFGKTGVPFGVFDTNLLSDPLTMALAETAVDAGAQVALEAGGFNAAVFVFNGPSKYDDDTVNDYAVTAGYAIEGDFSFAMQVGYMNNIGNTDTLSGYDNDDDESNGVSMSVVKNDVAAMTVALSMSFANFTLIGEYVAAQDAFENTELANWKGEGAEPSAWNAELAYSLGSATVAIGRQQTDDAINLGLSKARNLFAYSVELYENTTLTVEFANEEDYAGSETKIVTGQLAVEF